MNDSTLRLGIDVGGTKLEIIAIDEVGKELFRRRIPSPNQPDANHHAEQYAQLIAAIHALVLSAQNALGKNHHYKVGLGTPGALNEEGKIKNANSLCLNGRPFFADIRASLSSLGIKTLALANDANCFALSEATDGAGCINGKPAEVVFGVILGTGVGGGIIVGGRVLQGANHIAGEWGHNPLPWADAYETLQSPSCYCGKRGCIEAWLSGPALSADLNRQDGINIPAITIADIAKAPHALHHSACVRAIERYQQRLAKSLAGIINVLDPQVIVLGGGLSKIVALYDRVPKLWGQWVFSDRVHTQLRPPRHGDSSGVRGAAWLN